MNSKVANVIVIPSYREGPSLAVLLKTLSYDLKESDCVIVSNDSDIELRPQLENDCYASLSDTATTLLFSYADTKSGRGAAVRRAMVVAREKFPNLKAIIECDADGSHQPIDILRLRDDIEICDLLVGSRYLPKSSISGWSLKRRIFSKLLNIFIPILLGLKIHDVTNGLRKYSITAIDLLISTHQENTGFIYLSEQALLISQKGMVLSEIPIHFIERIHGSSSVTAHEITNSISGIVKLIQLRVKNLNSEIK